MLVRRWLDEAGISDPVLRQCYTTCVRSAADQDGGNARWWGLRAVRAALRPHVGALTALAVAADDRADLGPVEQRRRRFDEYTGGALAAIAAGSAADPVLHATAHTVRTFELPVFLFEEMFDSMRQDIEFREFTTYTELRQWSRKSTGAPMIVMASLVAGRGVANALAPVLREIGELFQFMDVLCDLGEDLRNGRLYLPLEDLDRFSVRPEDLKAGRWVSGLAGLIAFEADRITGRLPALLAQVRHPFGMSYAEALKQHCELFLREVLANGPALLDRPARPHLTGIVNVWRPQWRATIPC